MEAVQARRPVHQVSIESKNGRTADQWPHGCGSLDGKDWTREKARHTRTHTPLIHQKNTHVVATIEMGVSAHGLLRVWAQTTCCAAKPNPYVHPRQLSGEVEQCARGCDDGALHHGGRMGGRGVQTLSRSRGLWTTHGFPKGPARAHTHTYTNMHECTRTRTHAHAHIYIHAACSGACWMRASGGGGRVHWMWYS